MRCAICGQPTPRRECIPIRVGRRDTVVDVCGICWDALLEHFIGSDLGFVTPRDPE